MRSSATRLLPSLFVMVTGLTTASTAAAEGTGAPTAEARAQAGDLFGKSATAYRAGDFKQAAELLERAYALDPQPVLLYNLARAREGLGELDAAITTYERFLAEDPTTRDRGAIEQRLVTLKRQRDEREALLRERAAAQQKSERAPERPVDEPRKRTVFPYVVAGAGVVGLGVGAVLGLSAVSANGDAKDEPVQQRAVDQRDSAEGLATASTIMFVVGAALVTAGAVWWFVEGARASKSGSTASTTRFAVTPAGLRLETNAL